MALDVLTTVLSYALVYAGVYYGPSTDLAVNWTAINATTFWGPADSQAKQDVSVKTTKLTYEKDTVKDLKERLTRNISYVAPLEGVNFRYGFNRDELKTWTRNWAEYDFDGRLKEINSNPMYKTNVQGLDITFFRIKSKNAAGPSAVPVLMLHGFPSSPVEFFETATILVKEKKFEFDLIIPSLPGFGWSSGATKTGLGAAQVAVVMHNLMQRLGYQKYYVHGSDLGSMIGSDLATLYPQYILGYHTSWPRVLSPFAYGLQLAGALSPSFLTDEKTYDRVYPNYDVYSRIMNNIGYIHWHATKPDTSGIPLTDSAAGLLAWVLDIFGRQTNYAGIGQKDGGLSKLNKVKMFDNLMFYWAPMSMTTSARLHAETFNKAQAQLRLDEIPTKVPTWALQTKYALTYQPATVLKLKYTNLVKAEVLEHGGHFLGYEDPKALAKSITSAITDFKKKPAKAA